MKTLFALAFLLCISVAFGLKCYTCYSNTTMDDCDKNRKEMDCGSSYDRCGEMTFENNSLKRYTKFCTTKAFCNSPSSALQQCKDSGATCKPYCCDGDLCNGGAEPTRAFGLKCYTCYSYTTMDDCDKNRKETDCGSSYDRCGKRTFEYKSSVVDSKSYEKFCTTKAICDSASSALQQCKDSGATCKDYCCDGDLCNGVAAPTGAFGLKCYTCFTNTSMDDCDKNRKETDCGSSFDLCGKMTVEYKSLKLYRKFCITKEMCDSKGSLLKQCKDKGATCKADCCDGDLCNGGAAPMISVLLMVECSLIAFFR